MIESHGELNSFFSDMLKNVKCSENTNNYIISIYTKYISSNHDLVNENITLSYANAKSKLDFAGFQNLADYILFYDTIFYNKNTNKSYHDMIAKSSYNYCFKLINKKWHIFEELSQNLETIEENIKTVFVKNNVNLTISNIQKSKPRL